MSAATDRDAARKAEVERILKAFKLNPYDVLDLPAFATESEVKKQYRKKSLMIHPDKFKHEQGPEAFDLLKKAESQLSDEAQSSKINSIMKLARSQVIKSIIGAGYSTSIEDSDPRLQNLSPPFQMRLRAKAKEILIEDAMDKRQRQNLVNVNEREEQARKEAEILKRKRKQEEAKEWAENQQARVDGWRGYMKQNKERKAKKAKKNLHVLG